MRYRCRATLTQIYFYENRPNYRADQGFDHSQAIELPEMTRKEVF
jgi:hypothetical protein